MAKRSGIAAGLVAVCILATAPAGAAPGIDGVEARPVSTAQASASDRPRWTLAETMPAETMPVAASAAERSRAAARRSVGLPTAADVSRPVPLTMPRDADNVVEVTVGSTQKIFLPQPVTDVIIADPVIADVVVRDPSNVFLNGLAPGATDVVLVGQNGAVIREVEVLVVADLKGARRILEKYIPHARIQLEPVGDGVLMMGTVRSAAEAASAQAILETYLGGGSNKPTGGAGPGDAAAGGGTGAATADAAAGLGAAGGGGTQSERDQGETRIINALTVVSDQQVLLQVSVAEVQRATLKRLGVTWSSDVITPGGVTSFGAAERAASLVVDIAKGDISSATVDVLEREGLIKVLAEPTLTAINGETANFLAGGEIPIPVKGKDGEITVEFKPVGVGLSFTPVVLAENQLSLRVLTEVSRQDPNNSVQVPTTPPLTLPGLSVRRASSTIMLPSGGSMMIAGLIENNEFNEFNGVPGLMDLPILGALFRSSEFQANRTELIVIVRAFLARPIDFAADLALPTDGFVPSSDLDMYLMGRLMHSYGDPADPARERLAVAGPLGYIME